MSTDFDEVYRLYFEELSLERVLDIYELETASSVVVCGQAVAAEHCVGVAEGRLPRFGHRPADIDKAEDRQKFSHILDFIGVDQPRWKKLTLVDDAARFAADVSYPVLVRPS